MSKVGIETITVDSSLVSVITYARRSKMLYVTFKNRAIYLYKDVDAATYEDVRNSESIGKALHKEIFGVFKYERLDKEVSVKYPKRLIKRKTLLA